MICLKVPGLMTMRRFFIAIKIQKRIKFGLDTETVDLLKVIRHKQSYLSDQSNGL